MPEGAPAVDEISGQTRQDESSQLTAEINRFLESEIEVGSFPGASWAVGSADGITHSGAVGHAVLKPARIDCHETTIFDVASITKPLITGTLALKAWAEGLLAPGRRASEFLPELKNTEKERITILDLLTHRAGFQAWYPLYTQGRGDEAYLDALRRRPLRYAPGTRHIYSCLGFIMLHMVIERVFGEKAESLAERFIFEPLGLESSLLVPPPTMKYRIAATEWGNANEREMVARRELEFDGWREYMIWGEVNDGNSWYLDGYGGNAGLFSTARDVFEIARSYHANDERLLPAEIVDRSKVNYTIGLSENRGLGWQLSTPREGHPTEGLSTRTYGHTGFTGTSVFVDPERDLILVLLTNRLHPSTKPLNTNYIRERFHSIVTERMNGE